MQLLAQLMKKDPKTIAGEAGAVSLGLLNEMNKTEACTNLKEHINLDEHVQVLCINTESRI